MGINLVSILGAITVMLLIAEALTLPVDIPQANGEQDANMAEDKRPKYMETRDLSAFKDLVLYAMEKLAAEGRINPELLVSSSESAPEGAVERRGRHLGLCVRRRGSTLTPYPCWKAGKEKLDECQYRHISLKRQLYRCGLKQNGDNTNGR